MANSFDISDKPEIAANLVQILSNASALATIQTTTLPNIATQNTNIKSVVDAIADPQLPDILTAIGANETKIDAIPTEQFFSAIASDVILASADTERSHNTSTYTEVKKIFIDLTGTYRITFDLKSSTAGEAAYGKIYKNDVAYGTEQTNDTVSYVNKSEDLFFIRGDYAQLYIKISTAPYAAYSQNFKVKGSGSGLIAVVITD